jgi:gliding motility-associated-like protein
LSFPAASQTANFTHTGDNIHYCAPATIRFTQRSSGTPKGYLWTFGNGQYSNLANPEIVYDQPGSYQVRLITVYEDYTAEITKSITINRSASANFSVNRDQACIPTRISFDAYPGPGVVNYTWDFGDGTPVQSGTVTALDHSYSDYGEFNARLRASTAIGCEATYSRLIKIARPQVSGYFTRPSGCVPVNNSFNANVLLPPSSSVSTYEWNFGDGGIASSPTDIISHSYTSPGIYSPSVTITTIEGCTGTYTFDTVRYGIPPTNLVARPLVPVFCGSEAGQFVARATNADSYDWDFGGGAVVTVRDTFVEHKFSSLGVKVVKVTPRYNNCPGQTITMQVEVIGVIAKFNYHNTCNDKKTFAFQNTSDGNLSTILWRFGDQTPTVSSLHAVHTFPTSGVFRTKLYEKDNITGCIDSASARIFTANPLMVNPDHSICINSTTRFRIDQNYQNPAATYTWNVLGDTIASTLPTINMTATTLGYFPDNMVVIDNGNSYCPDSIRLNHPVTVRGPRIDFEVPSEMCLNIPLAVTNHSLPYQPADTIKTWLWNYGRPGWNDTGYQPRPYQFPVHKLYDIKLTAIDIYGCKDSLVKQVAVRPIPFLWIIPRVDTLCLGQRDSVIAYTSDNVLWSPSVAGPPFCDNCDSTLLGPTQTTRYQVSSTNSFGCSVNDSMLVKVYQPFDAIPGSPNGAICEGEKLQLLMNPPDKKITWTPAISLSNAQIFNPVAYPAQTTIYRANLEDSVGCFNSMAAIRVVVNPKPLVNAGPDKILPYASPFTLTPSYSSNVSQYVWSPADSLSCRTCPYPASVATRMKTYTIAVTSDNGCVSTDEIVVAVECNDAYLLMPAAFSPNNDGLNDLYSPITRGMKYVKHFSVYNRAGQLMYRQENFVPGKGTGNPGWNGKFNNTDQPIGTYVYIVEAVCEIGQTVIKKGSIVLLR